MRWIRETRERARAWLGPLWLGVIDSLGSLLGITTGLLLIAMPNSWADPSAQLFWNLAAIGATLFVAYSVALVAVGPQIGDPEHKNWLGSICGLGACAVGAIAASLALASSIALLPVIAASWRRPVDD